jgi:26S proteasome regulatory subunit N2
VFCCLSKPHSQWFPQDFNYPKKYEIQCNSKPSVFAYPKKLEEKKEEKKKRVETVTLSTTAKEKARQARRRAKEGDKGGSMMDIDAKEGAKDEDNEKKEGGADAMDVDANEGEGAAEEKPAKKKREPEPSSFRISNPARITIAQSHLCQFDLNQRYRPIRTEEKPFGVIILTDSTPGEEEDLGAVKAPSLEPEGETAPPEPFEWTPPDLPSSDGATAMETIEPGGDKPTDPEAEVKSK